MNVSEQCVVYYLRKGVRKQTNNVGKHYFYDKNKLQFIYPYFYVDVLVSLLLKCLIPKLNVHLSHEI